MCSQSKSTLFAYKFIFEDNIPRENKNKKVWFKKGCYVFHFLSTFFPNNKHVFLQNFQWLDRLTNKKLINLIKINKNDNIDKNYEF